MIEYKVSIIVPVYNVSKYLARCLESLITQTYKNLEIIVVDDGSTDGSSPICDFYEKKDSRIKVIHKLNEGLGEARNTGLEAGTGSYVMFVDSDDFVEKNAVSEMLEIIQYYNADMCMAGYKKYSSVSKSVERKRIFEKTETFTGADIKRILYRMIGAAADFGKDEDLGMAVWKNLYSYNLLRNTGVRFCSEREYISEDVIFHLDIVPRMKKIVGINKEYYYYCDNSDETLTSKFHEDKFDRYKKLYKKEQNILEQKGEWEEGKEYITRTFLGNVRSYMKQLVECNFPVSRKIEISRKIVNDTLIQNVLKWYPYERNPISSKIYTGMIRKKHYIVILILAKLQVIKLKREKRRNYDT